MSDLIDNVAQGIAENDEIDMAVSAISMPGEIGFPKRVLSDEGEIREGEHENFDEAYDYACRLLEVEDLDIEKEEDFVWFTKSE